MIQMSEVKVLRPTLPEGSRWMELLRPGVESKAVKVGYVRLRPGERIGEHNTGEREEVIYVVRGRGCLIAEDGRHPIEAGAVAYVPPNMRHDVENGGEEVLEYYYLTAPAP